MVGATNQGPNLDLEEAWWSSSKSPKVAMGSLCEYGHLFWRLAFWGRTAVRAPIQIDANKESNPRPSRSRSRFVCRVRAALTERMFLREGGNWSRATNMSVEVKRGWKRDLSLVVGNYVSLFETRGWSVPALSGGGQRAESSGHPATPPQTPEFGQPSPGPLSAAPSEPHHNGSNA